jgi:hypothetical protein
LGDLRQKGIANFPRRLLNGQPLLLLVGADIRPAAEKRNSQFSRELPDEAGLFFAFRPQAVIEMGRQEGKVEVSPQLPERMQEGHRVGSSGNSDHDPVSRLDHVVFLDGLSNFEDQGMHGGLEFSSYRARTKSKSARRLR